MGDETKIENATLVGQTIDDAIIKEPYEGNRVLERESGFPDFLQKTGELTEEQRKIIHDAVSTELGGPVKLNQEYFIDEPAEGDDDKGSMVTVTIGLRAMAYFVRALLETVSVGDIRKCLGAIDGNLADGASFYSDAEEVFCLDLAEDIASLLNLTAVRVERGNEKA